MDSLYYLTNQRVNGVKDLLVGIYSQNINKTTIIAYMYIACVKNKNTVDSF